MNNLARGFYEQSLQLSEYLQNFSFSATSTEPDPVVGVLGIQYMRITQIQLSMVILFILLFQHFILTNLN